MARVILFNSAQVELHPKDLKSLLSEGQLGAAGVGRGSSEVAPGNLSALPDHQAADMCCAANLRCSNCIGLR